MNNLANHLTVLRILLVPVMVGCLLYYTPEKSYLQWAAVAIFVAACLSDALDGYVARKFNQKTAVGSYLDPVADKLLLLSGFLSLSFMNHLPSSAHIPAWVTIPVVTRDAVILVGATMLFLTTGNLKAQPLFIGKLTTVSQMLTLFLSLLSAPDILRFSSFVATVILTVLSGILYIRMGERLMA